MQHEQHVVNYIEPVYILHLVREVLEDDWKKFKENNNANTLFKRFWVNIICDRLTEEFVVDMADFVKAAIAQVDKKREDVNNAVQS